MSLRKGLEKLTKDGHVDSRISQTRNTSLSNTALQLQKHSEDLDALFKRVEELTEALNSSKKTTTAVPEKVVSDASKNQKVDVKKTVKDSNPLPKEK